ncbi:MAG: hypothetical protein HOW73_12010 [Polyangiaceae bacterium]|nr:hypothetical protein [Polyangiaceae bacterium]
MRRRQQVLLTITYLLAGCATDPSAPDDGTTGTGTAGNMGVGGTGGVEGTGGVMSTATGHSTSTSGGGAATGGAGGQGEGGSGGEVPIKACTNPDTWTPTSLVDAPSERAWHEAVWTGTHMMVWGGLGDGLYLNSGGLYDPASDTWEATPTAGAPTARFDDVMVWTGSEVLIWGGRDISGGGTASGARFNPSTKTWSPMSTVNAPPPTYEPEGVWTGTELVVWGDDTTAGARYDPATDTWTPMNESSAPSPRDGYVMRWTDSELVVWGGRACADGACPYVSSGGRYNPSTNVWTSTSSAGAPEGTYWASGVWTGTELIVFGGRTCGLATGCEVATGGRYNPATDAWSPLEPNGAPSARHNHSGVWTGDRMLIWGGGGDLLDTGGLFDPETSTWVPTTTEGAPPGRRLHSGVWTDYGFVTWGGVTSEGDASNDGGVYCPP